MTFGQSNHNMMRFAHQLSLLFVTAFVLGACAETQLVVHAAKTWGRDKSKDAAVKYKIGNPYQIKGVWYYPAVNYSYVETGIASWYGPNFNKRPTANGELFDMNKVSAAHRTLPLPSMVQVTNLENGRSIRVRVNDRGPFAHSRIIDMSRRGAQLLGFSRKGTTRVRVRVLADESRQMAALSGARQLAWAGDIRTMPKPDSSDTPPVVPAPRGVVTKEALEGAPKPTTVKLARAGKPKPGSWQIQRPKKLPSETKVIQGPVEKTTMYIQAGAFTEFFNANRLKRRLSSFGNTVITGVVLGDQNLYRVRVGPIDNLAKADGLLEKIINTGVPGARITLER